MPCLQLDGGIDKVTSKVVDWFATNAASATAAAYASNDGILPPNATSVVRNAALDARALSIGLLLTGPTSAAVPPETSLLAAALVRSMVGAGGSVVLPSSSPLLKSQLFSDEVQPRSMTPSEVPAHNDDSENGALLPSIAFGQSLHLPARPSYACADASAASASSSSEEAAAHAGAAAAPAPAVPTVDAGLHVMDMPAVRDWSETVTGLAAAGVHIVLALTSESAAPGTKPIVAPGHPLIPVLHVGLTPDVTGGSAALTSACDVVLTPPAVGSAVEDTVTSWLRGTLAALAETAAGARKVKSAGATFFSITRGLVGVST